MSRAVQFSEYGPTSILNIVEVDMPEPEPDQVRIRVRAAGLNPLDVKVRSGLFKDFMPMDLPSGEGMEFAGIIDKVGSRVTGFHTGDEVIGSSFFAAQRDYLVTDTSSLAHKPATLSWEVAGGIHLTGQTAWYSFHSLNITKNDTVLISAAAGGVGIFASQLVKQTGATVIGTASEANHEFLRSLGVIPVTYGEGLADRIRLVAPQGITAVLDYHGRETIETGLALGVPPERINTVTDIAAPAELGVSFVGNGDPIPNIVEKLASYLADGTFVMPVEAVYALEDIVAAYDRFETGHHRGKIVVVTE